MVGLLSIKQDGPRSMLLRICGLEIPKPHL